MRITTESLTFVNPSASLVQIIPINIYIKVNFKFMTALYSTNQNFNQKCNIEKNTKYVFSEFTMYAWHDMTCTYICMLNVVSMMQRDTDYYATARSQH